MAIPDKPAERSDEISALNHLEACRLALEWGHSDSDRLALIGSVIEMAPRGQDDNPWPAWIMTRAIRERDGHISVA